MSKFTYESPYCTVRDCWFQIDRYADNKRKAISIWNEELGPVAKVTVSVEDDLSDEEIAVKDYAENDGMLQFLQSLGIIKEVKRVVLCGFVSVPVCTYDEEKLLEYSC